MRKLLLFLLFISFAPSIRAQCTGGASPNWTWTLTANTTSGTNNLQGCINQTVDGDTITISAGTATWTSGISISGKGITIIGTGTPNSAATQYGASASCASGTTILDQIQLANAVMITWTPNFGNSTSRFSCITLQPGTRTNCSPSPGTGCWSTPISITGNCTASGCPNFRIDNISFPNTFSASSPGLPDGAIFFINGVFGVADHNSAGNSTPPAVGYVDFINLGYGTWLSSSGLYGDLSWASADTFGASQQFFLENNVFLSAQATDTDIPSAGAARFSCRFNHFDSLYAFGGCTGHGTETTGRGRGIRQWEIYDNTANCSNNWNSQNCGSFSPGRGGVGMNFENALQGSGTGFIKGIANFDSQRTWRSVSTWGHCDGTGSWDENDGIVYDSGTFTSVAVVTGSSNTSWTVTDNTKNWSQNWSPNGAVYSVHDVTNGSGWQITTNNTNTLTIFTNAGGGATTPSANDQYQILRASACIDQPTRGAGILLSGNPPTPVQSVNQPIDPSYEAADSMTGNTTNLHTFASNQLNIIQNRDYYTESNNQAAQSSPTTPFNGTSGIGHGTLANRPGCVSPACTTGVAYWCTNCGSWNTTSNLSPVTGQIAQGQLFTWNGTAWTLKYTPYTYPHPLVSGSPTQPAATPTFSPAAGSYLTSQIITISSATGGATICYTNDGTAPTANGSGTCTHGTTLTIGGTVTVSFTQLLQAIASASGFTDSAVGSAQYTFPTATPGTMVAGSAMTSGSAQISGN